MAKSSASVLLLLQEELEFLNTFKALDKKEQAKHGNFFAMENILITGVTIYSKTYIEQQVYKP